MSAAKKKSAIEAWVDEHRELVILSAVLPIGKVLSWWDRAKRRWQAPAPSAHEQRVARVVAQVREHAALRQHGLPWDGVPRSAMYLNLGIYGTPKAIRDGVIEYPTVTKVRELERMIRERSGFLHTYVDLLSTEDELEALFDHGLWRQMRERYGANGVFPTVYEKIKPELDDQPFLDEETHWLATGHAPAR